MESLDRISVLPHKLLPNILCFLSQKEAVQTCVLAKSWRHLGSTRPVLELHEHNDLKDNKEKFMQVLNKTLQGYPDQNLLCIDLWTSTDEKLGLDQESAYSDLPSLVFQFESLQALALRGWNLSGVGGVISLKYLRKLFLDVVYVGDEAFEKIMSGCPLLEHADMQDCQGLTTMKVNKAPNLNYFAFLNYNIFLDATDYGSIEIDAPAVESISILSYKRKWVHKHFGHLKFLKLEWVSLTTELFRNFSSDFPCVEDLGLKSCYGLDKFTLSSLSIKSLSFDDMSKFEACFETPNLVDFAYKGFIPQSISFAPTTKAWESDLTLKPDRGALSSSWFLKLHQLLDAFRQSEILLHVYSHYNTNQHTEELRDIVSVVDCEPVILEGLLLDLNFDSYASFSAFANALFWVCHPREIYRYWYTSAQDEEENQVTEFLCKILSVDERNKDLEADMMRISRKRDVEEVSFFETFDVHNKEEWHPVHSSWLEYCAALLPPENLEDPHYLCFLLKWS